MLRIKRLIAGAYKSSVLGLLVLVAVPFLALGVILGLTVGSLVVAIVAGYQLAFLLHGQYVSFTTKTKGETGDSEQGTAIDER